MLDTIQQIFETIKKSQNILIAFKKNGGGDAIASSLALASFLKKMEKPNVDIISDQFVAPKNYRFLPQIDKIQPSLASIKKFIITLDTSKTKVNEFSYDMAGDKLNIYITPEAGVFKEQDVKTAAADFKYDLIFVLDSPDLESLGGVYEQQTEFFYHTPIINIDHDSANEYFGQINLVELTATSTVEILSSLFKTLGEQHLDEDMATYLLTGIISETRSFKTAQVTPRTLNMVGQLIAAGAKREEIIQNLYQTRSIATLKLWGRVLARLKNDPEKKLAWSFLNAADFEKTETSEEQLPDVIDELIVNSPDAKTVVLLYEKPSGEFGTEETIKVHGLIKAGQNANALELAKIFDPIGTKDMARFCFLNKPLADAEKEVIDEVKKKLTII